MENGSWKLLQYGGLMCNGTQVPKRQAHVARICGLLHGVAACGHRNGASCNYTGLATAEVSKSVPELLLYH